MGLRGWVRERLARRLGAPSIADSLARARRCGLMPGRIVDVGAYHGDFARLSRRLWPSTELICFEPLEQSRAKLLAWARTQPCVAVHDCLLGEKNQESVPLHVAETASSVLREHVNAGLSSTYCRMRRLDDVCAESAPASVRSLIKLDVQGYELEVLRGSEVCLRDADALLIEVNFLDIHRGVPLLTEITAWLAARGFVAYDICALTRRPLDQALWQADLLYVPESSPLRADKRWRGM